MKKKFTWFALSFLMAAAMLSASCKTSTTTTSPATTTQISTSTTTSASTTTTTTTASTTPTTTSVAGNWWDTFGKPQYGGDMVLRTGWDIVNFDPYNAGSLTTIDSSWMERLFGDDWTLAPSVWNYKIAFRPDAYVKGILAKSWEFTDPSTITVHIRQGIKWANIAPANSREFIADDVAQHYGRLFGVGSGYTKPSPFLASNADYAKLLSVTATDKYTVVFKWKISNPEYEIETLEAQSSGIPCVENPENVKQWGDLNDWHHAIGTGPFILTDFVSGGSATLVKNPNYWGYDERFPQNQLPYVNTLRILVIPDDATAMAGLRTGKIDAMDNISFEKAQQILKTNPEILQGTYPTSDTNTVDPRNDLKPFNDIRVRKAMQLAMDLPTLAKTYYAGTVDPWPSSLTSNYFPSGYGFPFLQWPQDLKDQYAYNPTAAKQLLADAGYPNGFNTTCVADSTGDLNLLQIVKSYLANIGINMSIQPLDYASWYQYVMTAHKQDGLAFRAAGLYGILYQPVRHLLPLVTGGSSNWPMISDPTYDSFNNKIIAATSIGELKQLLIDANKYVAEQHYVISLLQPNVYGLYQPWFKGGYSAQYESISGGALGPQLLGFYGARFWIDQNLKKSMGH